MKFSYPQLIFLFGLLGNAGCNSAATNPIATPPSTSAEASTSTSNMESLLSSIEKLVVKKNDKGEVVELDCRECSPNWLEQIDALKGNLNSLRSIRVSDNASTSAISQFPSLRNVYLYSQGITDEGVAKLAGLKELRVVNLIQTAVTDDGAKFLNSVPNLKEFGCFGTSLTQVALMHIVNPKGVTKLNLRASAITDEGLVAALPSFPNLESLELSENDAITDKCVAAIVALPKIVDVNFWLTKVSDAGVAQLEDKQLKRLNLDNIPEITNKSIESAVKIKSLEFLHLGKTSVNDEGIHLLATMPNLTELHLTQSKATAEGVEKLRVAMPNTKIVYGSE